MKTSHLRRPFIAWLTLYASLSHASAVLRIQIQSGIVSMVRELFPAVSGSLQPFHTLEPITKQRVEHKRECSVGAENCTGGIASHPNEVIHQIYTYPIEIFYRIKVIETAGEHSRLGGEETCP